MRRLPLPLSLNHCGLIAMGLGLWLKIFWVQILASSVNPLSAEFQANETPCLNKKMEALSPMSEWVDQAIMSSWCCPYTTIPIKTRCPGLTARPCV